MRLLEIAAWLPCTCDDHTISQWVDGLCTCTNPPTIGTTTSVVCEPPGNPGNVTFNFSGPNGGPGNHSGPGGFGNDHTVVLPVLPTYSLVTIKKFFKRDYLTPAQQAWWDQNPALATQIGQFLLQNHLYGFTQTPELPEDVALMVNAI